MQDYYEKGSAFVQDLVGKFNKKDELWWVTHCRCMLRIKLTFHHAVIYNYACSAILQPSLCSFVARVLVLLLAHHIPKFRGLQLQ